MAKKSFLGKLSDHEKELPKADLDFLLEKSLWTLLEFVFFLIEKEPPKTSSIEWTKYPNVKKIFDLLYLTILEKRIESKTINDSIFLSPQKALHYFLKHISENLMDSYNIH